MVPPIPGGSSDPQNHIKYFTYITTIGDPAAKDETKIQALQELSENFEVKSLLRV